ncbi:MAG TPA: SIR2 family protein [Pseudolabrys sp.]|jgi:hypothetical protein|nr:SIR2 family protein [Pseudolabrys sp.]
MDDDFDQKRLLNHFLLHAPQIMWFLGAGASRTSGMPTATDILWDLKRRYYCIQENQKLNDHDVDKRDVKARIQSYLDGKGFPAAFSSEEYSFYFDLIFGNDRSAQQTYIFDQLAPDKITLSIGQRVLAAFLASEQSKVIFTTNFDDVVETAFSKVALEALTAFHLDGSYAALDALNSDRFPLYAKLHGDFRYKNIKNIAADLRRNDEEIQKCFLAASTRFGMIVSGYSGRDANVMKMFHAAIEQNNAFPQGLLWTTTQRAEVSQNVINLLDDARKNGILAHVVDAGTFDVLLLKLWRLTPEKDPTVEQRVQSGKSQSVHIDLKPPGNKYPILRTNALPITSWPTNCGKILTELPVTFTDIIEKRKVSKNVLLTFTGDILFWGEAKDAENAFSPEKPIKTEEYKFEDAIRVIGNSGIIKSFFEEALATSLCQNRPLLLRRNHRTWNAVVDHRSVNDPIFKSLKAAVGYQGKAGTISGAVSGSGKAHWSECVSMRLEEKNGALWLLLRPDIWISPRIERENSIAFLRQKKLYRRNIPSFELLNAWIEILLGSGAIGSAGEVEVSYLPNAGYTPRFRITTRTAFSAQG